MNCDIIWEACIFKTDVIHLFCNNVHLQTVDNSSSLPLLSFALPLVNLKDQFKERAFGGGNLPMPRPPQVLELTDH